MRFGILTVSAGFCYGRFGGKGLKLWGMWRGGREWNGKGERERNYEANI